MKRIMFASALLILVTSSCFADEYVRGYTRKDGTYVNPYTRSSSDSSYNNNYSTSPNVNPYTGQRGTNAPTYNDRTPSYNMETTGNRGTYSNPYNSNGTSRGSSRSIYGGY
jgi:hypothetical protein